MITLKNWVNPKNNEERIYISGIFGQKSSKIFIVKQDKDSFGYEFDIRVQIPKGVYSKKADLVNETEKAINELFGLKAKTFEQVKSLVK